MKRFALAVFLMAISLTLSLSCGDKSTDSDLIEGDYNNEDFIYARQDADSTIAELSYDDQEIGDLLGWNPGPAMLDSVVYDSTSGWHLHSHVVNFDFLELAFIDSFRFTNLDQEYQRRHDSTTNILERRLKKSFLLTANPDSQGTYWTKNRSRNTVWAGLADTVTILNGNFHRHWAGQSAYRSFTRIVEGDFDNISFYTSDIFNDRPAYPFAGTLTASVSQDAQGPNRQIHLEGTLTVTFRMEGDHHCYHARLVRGDNWWEWDRCFPDSLSF